jgi:hypothetical protein
MIHRLHESSRVRLVLMLFAGSFCGALSLTAQTTPTLAIQLSPVTPEYSDTTTVSATITGSGGTKPSGTVTYSIDGGASSQASVNSAGVSYFPIKPLVPSAHKVSVSYSGDSNYNAVSSQTQSFNVADRVFEINASTYPLYPVLYVNQGGTYTNFGVGGVAVDPKFNVYLAYGNSGTGVAAGIGEITNNGLGYRAVPVTGLGMDTRLAVDTGGNLYISDPTNSRVIEYSTAGVQTVLSLTGLMTPSCITFDAASGSLFILDSGLGGVVQFNLTTRAQTTTFSGVTGLQPAIATDGAGGIYYAIGFQLMFRAVDGTVSPIFGEFNDGVSSGTGIFGLAFDPVRKYLWVDSATNGGVGVIRLDALHHASNASGGQAGYEHGEIALDSDGKAYTPGTVYTDGPDAANLGPTIGYPTSGAYATFELPSANGTPGVFQSSFAPGISGSATAPLGFGALSFNQPFNTTGTYPIGNIKSFPVYGRGYGQWMISTPGSVFPLSSAFGQPAGIAVSESFVGAGDTLYVSDNTNNTVSSIVYGDPSYGSTGGPTLYTQATLAFNGLVSPTQLSTDGSGDVWVLDQGASSGGARIVRLSAGGTQTLPYTAAVGDPLGMVQNVAAFMVDGSEALYLGGSNHSGGVIVKIDPRGLETTVASGIEVPAAMTIDADSSVYSVDMSGKLVKIDRFGAVTTITTGLPSPTQISIDASGVVYLSSATAKGVLTIAPDGTEATITLPGVANPTAAAVDFVGSIHVTDGVTKMAYVDYRSEVNIDFSSAPVGVNSTASQNYVVSDIGNLSLGALSPTISQGTYAPFSISPGITNGCQFAGAATPTLLAPAQSCQVQLEYAPTKVGTDTASASLYSPTVVSTYTVGPTLYWNLNGKATTAVTAPAPALNPATLSFGSLGTGVTSTAQIATLSNTGNAQLTISSFAITGSNASSFSQTSTCGTTLAAAASCSFSVTCTPATAGALAATLAVNYPSPLPQQTVALSCTGTAATAPQAVLTPATASFGSVTAGTTSAAQTFTLTNAGTAALPITSIALNGTNANGFNIGANTCGSSLAAASSCIITVTFSPGSAGSAAATLSVADSVGTQSSALTGIGTAAAAPQAALSPSTANFGSVSVGTASSTLTFTLSNAGTAALAVTSASLGGVNAADFSIASNNCTASLAAGSSCMLTVSFKPTVAMNEAATLSIVDGVGAQTASLTGTGIAVVSTDFGIAATPPLQTVSAGSSASYSVSITPLGGSFSAPVALSATGFPPGAIVTFTPASLTPSASAATSTLTIATATLLVHHQAPPLWPMGAPVLATGLLMIPLFRRKRVLNALICFIVLLGTGGALVGCGGGWGYPSITYDVTVTGTSGSLQHSTIVQITVK